MRKAKKSQALNLIDILKKGIKALDDVSYEERLDILQAGQECIIALGSLIESEEGENHPMIDTLEELCDFIYHVYCGECGDDGGIYQRILQAEKRLQQEISSDTEVVFMPAWPDDWDRMEKIWRRAAAEESCAVSVVPVPISILDKNGRILDTFINSEGWSKGLEITDYREYDLELYQPDVIVVSRLAENMEIGEALESFTCKELAAHTRMIVHLSGALSDRRMEAENSELIWKSFRVNERDSDSMTEDSQDVKRPIPDCWRDKIGDKKVFLAEWDAHDAVTAPDMFRKRLIELAETTKECGAVLWLRINPLISPAFRRAGILAAEEFDRLMNQMEASRSVIVDDTPDYLRAAGYADAYIGGAEKVVPLAWKKGKPVFVTLPFEDRKKRNTVSAGAAVAFHGRLYLSDQRFNGFFCLDTESGELKDLGKFQTEKSGERGLHAAAAVYKNSAFFIPGSGDVITRVNLESLEMQAIPLPDGIGRQCKMKFNSAAVEGRFLWMIPGDGGAVVKLDMESGEQRVYRSWPRSYDFTKIPFKGGTVCAGLLWICPHNSRSAVCLDPASGRMTDLEWDLPEQSVSGVTSVGDALWFSPQKGDAVLKLEARAMRYRFIEEFPDTFWAAEDRYGGICQQDGALWMMPYHAASVLKIDLASGRKRELSQYMENSEIHSPHRFGDFSIMLQEKHAIFMISEYTGTVFEINTENETTRMLEMEIPEENFLKCMERAREAERINHTPEVLETLFTDNEVPVEKFCSEICSGNRMPAQTADRVECRALINGKPAGEIWKEIWEQIS